jgi:siroheme synthase (precorrin-2 oxidase/ferrochelatase)
MSNTHTPLPWQVEDNLPPEEGTLLIYAPNAGDGWHQIVAFVGDMENVDGEDLANAAFIVHACNSHDDLVAALQEARRETRGLWYTVDGAEFLCDRLDSILAKATGNPT